MTEFRVEKDSLGEVRVPADKLWGAQTQRSLDYFSIGRDLMPREMIAAYAILKRAAATANHEGGRLSDETCRLIVEVCDEILEGRHDAMFPLHVLDDRERHPVQHERQRGDRQPLLGARRRAAREQASRAPQRSREYGAVDQRHLSLGHVDRRGGQRQGVARPCGRGARARHRRESGGMERHRQDRAHPSPGRDALDAGPGILGLRGDACGRHRADRVRARPASIGSRSAARPSAPASIRRRASPRPRPRRSQG